MESGLECIAAGSAHAPSFQGERVALLVNATAIDARGRHAVDVFRARQIQVTRLLGAEHGIWSTHEDMEPVPGGPRDPVFGLPVVSLYGDDLASLTPRPEALADIDRIVYDIQDIGARYYTFAATLAFVMRAAAARDLPVTVLDRPNPIGPTREGPLLRPGFESFCGITPGLPIRHGLTVGALATWYRARLAPTCALSVVACDPTRRPPFVPPSPNMPTWETALLYPGLCLVEGTTLSEGRGTTSPFRQIGAPNVNPVHIADLLTSKQLPGVAFAPVRFRPHFGKHAGLICGGVYLRIVDPDAVAAVDLGVHVLSAFREVAPTAWTWRHDAYEFVRDRPAIDLLWGSTALRDALDSGADLTPLLAAARAEAAAWDPATPPAEVTPS